MNIEQLPLIQTLPERASAPRKDIFLIKTKWHTYFDQGEPGFVDVFASRDSLPRTLAELSYLNEILKEEDVEDLSAYLEESKKQLKSYNGFGWVSDKMIRFMSQLECEKIAVSSIIYYDNDGLDRKSTFKPSMMAPYRDYIKTKTQHLNPETPEWGENFLEIAISISQDFNILTEKNKISNIIRRDEKPGQNEALNKIDKDKSLKI